MNKLLSLFKNKRYEEGKLSTVLHLGEYYLVDDLIKLAEGEELVDVDLKDLEWFLPKSKWLSSENRERAMRTDLTYPPILIRVELGLVSLDGYHRILKARYLGKETIPSKILTKLPKPIKRKKNHVVF